LNIRKATEKDFESIWPFFKTIVEAGETYAIDRNISKEDALNLWIKNPRETYVIEMDGQIGGTYYIKDNHGGPGNHVCNCGYMVSPHFQNRGYASALGKHSIKKAKELKYRAIQYNFVVSSNKQAIYLWQKNGFQIVGTLPKAFLHPEQGYIDAYVMFLEI